MKKNYSTILAGLITLLFIMFAGYGVYKQSHPVAPKTINKLAVAFQEAEINTVQLLDIAEEQGYFKQSGLEIERKTGLKSISTFVTSGQVDVAIASMIPALSDFYSGQDVKLLAVNERYTPSLRIVSRFPLEEISKVKNVAINRPGGAPQNMFWIMSKNLGIDRNSVKYVVAADPQTAVALLEKGSIDFALISNEEAYSKVRDRQGFYTISAEVAYKGIAMPDGIYSSSKILDEGGKADDLKKFVAAMKKASAYFDKHKGEMVPLLTSKYGVKASDAEETYNGLVAAKVGTNYGANTNLFGDIIESVNAINKPTNSNRNLQELLDPRFN